MNIFSAAELQDFATGIVSKMGAPADIAHEVGSHLVRSNLSGYDSHGVMRLPQYFGLAQRGDLAPANRPIFVHDRAAIALIDAQRGFGHYSTAFALDCAARKAKSHGVGAVAVRHSTHVGRLGEFTERCDALGLVLMATVGMAGRGVGGMTAYGGRERFFGANVWSVGVPGVETSMVFDGSMANIAVGKVIVAKMEGDSLPESCLIDKDGAYSTDPQAYFDGGAVVPMGGALSGHKGYGLALASALLSGLAMIGDDSPTLAGAPVREGAKPLGRMAGVFLIAIDPELFGGAREYRNLVEDCLGALKDVVPAPGFDSVAVPGERSRRLRNEGAGDGIGISETTCAELASLADRLDMPMAVPMARRDSA